MKLKSINPFTNALIAEFEEFGEAAIGGIVDEAKKEFSNWRVTSFQYRAELMKRLAECLINENKICASLVTNEMGKPISESIAEINKCAWVCEYYAENAEKFLATEEIKSGAQFSGVFYEPIGIILGIMPWNYPFWQVFRFLAPTIMAGNVALLKHASNVQGCAGKIEELFKSVGFPKGIMQNLQIGSEKVAPIIEKKEIKSISFTGSEIAGSKVAELSGKNVKKTVLELGGSNAFIVFKDADIQKAAVVGVNARMMNCGQSCIAAKRFLVHESVYEEFVEKFLEALKSLRIGDPNRVETQLGPLSGLKQAQEIELQVSKSLEMGARLLVGGERTECFYQPTLVSNVVPGMPLWDEEVFGPVASVVKFAEESEAIKLANSSRFGLGVSLFTSDLKNAQGLIPKFEDGAVFINSMVMSDPRLPFGGTKKSGYGRELSVHGIREFINVKTAYIAE